ncbi:hypothetical protein [Flammeovirga aprica]|uniref:Outer membrane protein beta-barrel domain-containing protein n=1 Tax=Flammeovirga aprica JL-4 TaxID=694437 RepID=A0A7X9XBM1_9BACT|nr:hypothetical protein [Flammeovirga aprica]NME70857.1 hypothetical protein [Flammeovirga aprica JL-4]
MKNLFLTLAFTLTSLASFGQFLKDDALYISPSIGGGDYFYFGVSLDYIINEKYSIGISGLSGMRNAKSTPEDYDMGVINGIFTFGTNRPMDYTNIFQFLVGRTFILSKDKDVRANLMLGLSISEKQSPSNWVWVNQGAFLENYLYEQESYWSAGLILKPKLEIPFSRFFGISFSPFLVLSQEVNYGCTLDFNLGKVRNRNSKNMVQKTK